MLLARPAVPSMARLIRKRRKKPGTAPGTLAYTGPQKVDEVRIRFIDYDGEGVREREPERVEACFPLKELPTVSWINVDGLHDVGVVEELGKGFGIHHLVLEDVLSPGQRPKVEEYDDFFYIVLRMLSWDEEAGHIHDEQLSMIVGENHVLTFQERPGDLFDPVRERIRGGKPRIRSGGADYLAYALTDAIVDSYFNILEHVGDRIEALEEEVLSDPEEETIHRIFALKRESLLLRKSIWPLREVLSSIYRGDSGIFSESTQVYVRDVYDHTVQVIDTVETLRDITGGLIDLHLSSVSNRMNEVMKVLTIMATIFIPLTFVAGIYGMNFEHMPELGWRWGYFAALGAMGVLGGVMVLYFRRRGWL